MMVRWPKPRLSASEVFLQRGWGGMGTHRFLPIFLCAALFCALLLNVPGVMADESIQLTERFGIGARPMGMGGTGIAVAEDFSALYWNPAGLAQIRRIEFSGGFSHQKYHVTNTYYGTTEDDSENNTHLNSLGLVFPVPTYRGSLVFALGVGRVENFDALFVQRGYVPADDRLEHGREVQSGGLFAWSLGGAVDVSPTLSLGAAIALLDGDYNYDWDASFADINNVYNKPPNDYDTTYIHDTKTVDFDGVSLQVGGLLRLNRYLRAGMTIHSPVSYDLSGEAEERTWDVFDDGTVDRYTDSYYFQNEISTPWEFGFGLAWSIPTLLFAGDLRYADWSQMKFNDQPLQEYDETLSWSLGGEYVLPRLGMKFRAGYASDPIAFNVPDILEDRDLYSLGAGFLVGQVMTLDVAWVKSSWKTAQTNLVEKREVERLFLSMAYRF
jgi:long-subunit fatty acid transport protein